MDRITDQLGHLQLGNVSEHLDWLPNDSVRPQLDREQLCEWLTIGAEELGDIRPYDFCPATLIDRLVDTLHLQVGFTEAQKTNAGKRLNLFECVGKQFFSTRTAMKCANLDALLRFTNPLQPDGRTPLVGAGEMFTYADVTNSDDYGVVEYIQWRKGQFASGYAFDTGVADRHLWSHALADARPKSQLQLGVRGSSTDPATIREFIEFVHTHQPDGVHLAYSEHMRQPDDGHLGIRENRVKQQVLSYCALCLGVVRPHGTMIVKLMETYTPFTVGLIYLLRQCFARMCLIKPNSSRASSGERYLMLQWRRPDVTAIREHLLCTNESLARMAEQHNDVRELVPLDVLRADGAFDAYVRDCNERLADVQTRAAIERLRFMNAPHLQQNVELKLRMRSTCLQQWNIPDFDEITQPREFVRRLRIWKFAPVRGVSTDLNVFTNLVNDLGRGNSARTLNDWYFAGVSQPNSLTYYVSMGMGRIWMWDGTEWMKAPYLDDVELPSGTLLYGEVVCEATTTHDAHVSTGTGYQLHVIDVLCIHFDNMHRKPLIDRRRRLQDFVQNARAANIRMRNFFPVAQLRSWVQQARKNWKLVDDGHRKQLMFKATPDNWYTAAGVAFYDCDGRKPPIGDKPLFWKWESDVHSLLNAEVDQPTHFHWFEQRLATLRPVQRFEQHRPPRATPDKQKQPYGIYRRPRDN